MHENSLSRAEWHENIISIANIVLDLLGDKVETYKGKPFFADFLLNAVEEYMKDSPSVVGHEHEYIMHSGKKELSKDLWKDCSGWDSVLINVSYACVCHDITRMALSICDGKAPRRPNQFK